MAETGNVFVRIGASIDDFEKNMRIVEQNIKNIESRFSGMKAVGDKLSSVGKSLAVGVTLPLAAAAGASLKAAGDFESMGNTFHAVSGATSEQMQKMSELAKQLGNDITLPGTSATDAAAAMTELAKAGLSIDDTFKAVKATLQLSAAAQIDNAEAATIVGQALNAFGLSGDKAATVADLLANSANASAGEITDMAYALQAAGAVANMSGQSIQDTVTAISLMANAGIAGSDAGTSLKSMLMSLISPTDKAAETMQKYGISVYDANGKMKSLPALVQEFSTKLGGLSQEQKNAALATIFGSDAIRAANIVLMGGTDAWNQMSQAVNKAGGAQEVAASKMKGFNGALESFKSTVETLAITIGEKLLPIVTPMIQRITDWINKFSELSPITQKVIIALAGIVAAIGPVILMLGQLMTSFVAIKAGLTMFGIGATTAGAAAGTAAGSVGLLGAVFKLLTGPVGIAIAAITAAITVGILLYQNWDKISAWLTQTWETIKQTAINVWNNIVAFFINLWNGIVKTASNIWNSIKNAIITPIQDLFRWLRIQWLMQLTFEDSLFNQLKNIAATIWEGIKTVIMAPVIFITQTVPTMFQALVDALVAAFQWLYNHNYYFEDLVNFIVNAFKWLQTTIPVVWNAISNFLITIWNNIRETAITIWNTITTTLTTIWNTIKNTATTVWTEIKNAIIKPINDLLSWLKIQWLMQLTFEDSIYNKMKNAAANTWNAIKNTITTLFTSARNNITSIANSIHNTISGIWNRIVSTIKSIGSRIWQAIIEPFNIAKQKVLSIVSEAYNWGRNLIQNVVDGIKSMIGKVASAAKNVASTVASFLGFHSPAKEGPGAEADKWMPNLMNMLNEGIQQNIPKLQATLNTALETPLVANPSLTLAGNQTNDITPISFERMFEGANIYVRSDSDIKQIAREIYNLYQSRARGTGVLA